jgi:hypothetical protein
MPARTEAHQLARICDVGLPVKILTFETRDIYQQFFRSGLAR